MNDSRRPALARTLEFEGTRNFRDFGGIQTPTGPTRYGVLYRSDRLSNLTPEDGARLIELGITTVIDMRTAEERARAPNRLPPGTAVRQVARAFLPRHTLPMFDAINTGQIDRAGAYAMMIKQYEALALEHTADYGRIIDDLLAPGSVPAIVHCTSGKDRTGMVAAIILLALNVAPDAIAADYTMTQDRIEKVDYFTDSASAAAIEVIMAAKPDYIHAAIATMASEFGSVSAYLREGVGLDAEKCQALRAMLVAW